MCKCHFTRVGDRSTGLFLEVGRTIAAAATYTEDELAKPSGQRAVNALESFVQISREATDESLAQTFVWNHAAASVFRLQDENAFSTFAYLIATRADIEGATTSDHLIPGNLR